MRWFPMALVVLLAGCDFFSPPCAKVARKVCSVESEGDACAFLLHVDKGDKNAQDVCYGIKPAAYALAEDPMSGPAREGWKTAREQLATLGFATDPMRNRIETKLKRAGGTAGKIVESIETNNALGEKKVLEAVQELDSAAK